MRRCKLGDIAELTVGFVGNMTKEYTEHGIPFLRSLNIKPFMIDDSDLMYITERFNTVLKKSALHTGDIVIVRTGIPGTCCVIPEEYDNTNCADMVIVRTNEVNPYFLAGYINFWGQKQIRSQKVGAVQKHFNVASAKEMIIYIPNDQEKIATLLKSINDKIALNNRVNATLEAMAKTLYDYWFVQFDFPDEKGRPYKTSGGKMVYNEELGREIPAGWEVETLDDLLRNDSSAISREEATHYPYTPVDILPSRKISFGSGDNTNSANTSLIFYRKGAILFGAMRAYFHRVCIAPFDGVTRTTSFVLYPKDTRCLGYAYSTLNLDSTVQYAVQGSVGTQQPYAVWANNLNALKVPKPSISYKLRYSNFFDKIKHKVIHNELESAYLAKLRDWLLPMLMNGQVRFKGKSNE